MENVITKIGRMFFLSVLGVFLLSFVIGGCVFLLKARGKSELVWTNLNDGQSLAVAAEASEEEVNSQSKSIINGADARPVIIEKYLEKYKSPLLPYAQEIFDLSETYGFEYYWIVAIAQQESNLCKKIPDDSFNCWGYGIHKKGTLRFENYDLALKSYAEYLKREYFDKGLNTPELIMRKYCPSSNGSWARGVQQFIDEMESGKFLN